jgi:hypothetical protein
LKQSWLVHDLKPEERLPGILLDDPLRLGGVEESPFSGLSMLLPSSDDPPWISWIWWEKALTRFHGDEITNKHDDSTMKMGI